MASIAQLEITSGTVSSVTLSSETGPSPDVGRRRGGRLAEERINIMQLSLTFADGKSQTFDFRNTTVGVKEGHDVTVVRARRSGSKQPLTLMLINRTTGQRDEFPDNLRRAASQKGLPARVKAAMIALPIGLLVFAVSYWVTFAGAHVWAAAGLGFAAWIGSFILIWAIIALADQIRLPAKDRAEVQRLRTLINEHVRATPTPSPAPHSPH